MGREHERVGVTHHRCTAHRLWGGVGALQSTVITQAMVFVALGLLVGNRVLELIDVDAANQFVRQLAEATLTLVLFTDGLVESRAADIDEGLAHLLAAAEAAGTSDPDELCDRLLADLTGAHRADDIALLVLTRTG